MRRVGCVFLLSWLAILPLVAESQPRRSPFQPPAAEAPAPAVVAGAHEFTGVIVVDKSVLINLTDTQKKRSFWINVGKSSDGIEVTTYDPKKDQVTVRIGGEAKTLALKQPAIAARSGNAVATVPVAPNVPLPPPATPAEAEREARMLVSDLLEIGMQQRKAYEEAQRKAAVEAAKKSPPETSPSKP